MTYLKQFLSTSRLTYLNLGTSQTYRSLSQDQEFMTPKNIPATVNQYCRIDIFKNIASLLLENTRENFQNSKGANLKTRTQKKRNILTYFLFSPHPTGLFQKMSNL